MAVRNPSRQPHRGPGPRGTPFRRQPRQARARRTLRSIQQACLTILETEGESALNTNRIAEVAGISVGTLYKYFPHKEAIVDAVCSELLRGNLDHAEVISDRSIELARRSLDETIRYIVDEELARHRRILERLKGFYLDVHWQHDFHRYVVSHLPHRMLPESWLRKVLDRYADDLRITDTALAAELVVNAVAGTIHSVLSRNPDLIFEDRFRDELVALVLAYLRPPQAGGTAQARSRRRRRGGGSTVSARGGAP